MRFASRGIRRKITRYYQHAAYARRRRDNDVAFALDLTTTPHAAAHALHHARVWEDIHRTQTHMATVYEDAAMCPRTRVRSLVPEPAFRLSELTHRELGALLRRAPRNYVAARELLGSRADDDDVAQLVADAPQELARRRAFARAHFRALKRGAPEAVGIAGKVSV